jgi:hypothetical protein
MTELCSVDGCGRDRYIRGYCIRHYAKWRRYKDPLAGPRTNWHGRATAERFWEKVDRRGPDECWPWIGARNSSGYGSFASNHPDCGTGAHRFSYVLAHPGESIGGRDCLHSCDNPPCVNPAHLGLGTRAENMAEMAARARHPRYHRTHCARGHELTPDTAMRRGSRLQRLECRLCRAKSSRGQWQRHKAICPGRSCVRCENRRARKRANWQKRSAVKQNSDRENSAEKVHFVGRNRAADA